MKLKAFSGIMLTLILIGASTIAFNIQPLKAEPTPVISVCPPISTALIGETFSVNVTVTGIVISETPPVSNGLFGWEAWMTFDPDVLHAVNATEGPFLESAGYPTLWRSRINNTEGTVRVGATIFPPFPQYGSAGSGILATLTFEVVSEGTTSLHFETPIDIAKTNLYTIIANNLVKIPFTAEDGLFLAPPLPPPTIHVSPSEAPIGSKINISGEGFAPNQGIFITFEDMLLSGSITTDEKGEFNATLFVPMVNSGDYTIKAMPAFPYQVAIANASCTVTLGVDDLFLQYAYSNSSYNELKNYYDDLSTKYNQLDSNYSSLQADYDDLESRYDTLTAELGASKNLSYLFVITTIIFIATTVYIAIRKLKAKPELKAT